ncbi:hypothetical protein PTKIN_Ptkin06aG0122900 [Pterospermum kingtungense]
MLSHSHRCLWMTGTLQVDCAVSVYSDIGGFEAGEINVVLLYDTIGVLELSIKISFELDFNVMLTEPKPNTTEMQEKFPELNLEDMVPLNGGGPINALLHPLHKSVPRVEAKKYIRFYENDESMNGA